MASIPPGGTILPQEWSQPNVATILPQDMSFPNAASSPFGMPSSTQGQNLPRPVEGPRVTRLPATQPAIASGTPHSANVALDVEPPPPMFTPAPPREGSTSMFTNLGDNQSPILKEVKKIPSTPAHFAIIIGIITCVATVLIPLFGAMLLLEDENYTFWFGNAFPLRVIAVSTSITLLLVLVCGLLYKLAPPQRHNEHTMALVASVFAALLGISFVLTVLPAAQQIQTIASKLSHGCSSSLSDVVALSEYGQVLANLRSNSTCAQSISVETCDGWALNKYTNYIHYLENEFECQVCPGMFTSYSFVQGRGADTGASWSSAKYRRQGRLEIAGHSSRIKVSAPGPRDDQGAAPKLFSHGTTTAPCLPLVATRMNVLAWTSYDLIFCEGVALVFVSLIVSCSSCLGLYCIKPAPSAGTRRGMK